MATQINVLGAGTDAAVSLLKSLNKRLGHISKAAE